VREFGARPVPIDFGTKPDKQRCRTSALILTVLPIDAASRVRQLDFRHPSSVKNQ